MSTETTELVVVDAKGITPLKVIEIKEAFLPMAQQFAEWNEKADGLEVTDISQKKEMKMAREARLAIVKIRTDADKKKKELKEEPLAYNKQVDKVFKTIEDMCKPLEAKLKDKEEFAEREEQKRLDELRQSRIDSLTYEELVLIPSHKDIEKYSEEEWNMAVNGAKAQIENKLLKEQNEKLESDKQAESALSGGSSFHDGTYIPLGEVKEYNPNAGPGSNPITESLENASTGKLYRILGTSDIVLKSAYTDPVGNIQCYLLGSGELFESDISFDEIGVQYLSI